MRSEPTRVLGVDQNVYRINGCLISIKDPSLQVFLKVSVPPVIDDQVFWEKQAAARIVSFGKTKIRGLPKFPDEGDPKLAVAVEYLQNVSWDLQYSPEGLRAEIGLECQYKRAELILVPPYYTSRMARDWGYCRWHKDFGAAHVIAVLGYLRKKFSISYKEQSRLNFRLYVDQVFAGEIEWGCPVCRLLDQGHDERIVYLDGHDFTRKRYPKVEDAPF